MADITGEIRAPKRIWAFEDRAFTKRWRKDSEAGGTEYVRSDVIEEFLRTATELVEDMNKLGYGYSAERPLPGAIDPFLKALEEVKR